MKCPHCGKEIEGFFATTKPLVPDGTNGFLYLQPEHMMYGDMIPQYKHGQWWICYADLMEYEKCPEGQDDDGTA